jgi:hypothetical protein
LGHTMETGTFKIPTCLSVLLALIAGARSQFTTYPQPSSTSKLPQDSLTQYSGNFCSCDLTAYACDNNCCCDTLCTEEDKLLFTSCAQETSLAPELNYCIDEALVATVQLPLFLVLGRQERLLRTGKSFNLGTVAIGEPS